MPKMNVLLLMTDQHRADCLGCMGNPVIQTPNLDWLAGEGTLFTRAYTPSPSCIPARACLMTGMDPWNTGILGMGEGQGGMGVGFAHTLPGELAGAGYHTQGIGKMHFGPQRSLNGFHNTVLDESGRVVTPGFKSDYAAWFEKNREGDYGFSDHGVDWNSWMARPTHVPEYLHPTFWTASEAISFLQRRDPTTPFFLKTSFARPHSPYDPPEYYFRLYERAELPEAETGEWDAAHGAVKALDPNAWQGRRSREEVRLARQAYYGSVTFIDHQIGRLLAYMGKQRLLDNTLILFTSDHGDMLGDHYLWRKTYAYESSARIPLFVRLPGLSPSTCDTPVLLQDLMPTILDALGLPIPGDVDGHSLLPLMKGDTIPREYIHGEHSACYSRENEMQYLTDGCWKYIWFPRTGREQLFHLTEDPGERQELSRRADCREALLRWRGRMVDVLAKRNAGLTDGENLVRQDGPIISPHYEARVGGKI